MSQDGEIHNFQQMSLVSRLFEKKVPSAQISRASSRPSLCACAVTSTINLEDTDAIS